MANARKELLKELKDTAKIKCALILWVGNRKKVLRINHDNNDYNEFLNSLNFEYDSGSGTQELYGTVWLEDGTWLSRREHDGWEWWEHNILPDIPAECM